jgi:uncharacterized protein (TIGR03067 family)
MVKRSVPLLLATALLLAAQPAKDDVKKELDKFQGTWRFFSYEEEGTKLGEEALHETSLVIKGDAFTVTEGSNNTMHGTFKFDLSKKPKTIDITFTDGPQKGLTMLGIYELEGDTYKICLNAQGKKRPTEFAAKNGDAVEVLKREKPKP